MNKLILAALTAGLAANLAYAQSTSFNNGVMVDSQGRTLYTFDNDANNKSNCNGACAVAWPPFIANLGERAGTGMSIITRDDGAKQFALNGKPLYYFAADANAGDIKGDKASGVWHVIRAGAQRAPSQSAARPAARQDADSYGYGGSAY